MENASKALIIAGAILLAIAIIAIAMFVFSTARDSVTEATSLSTPQIQAYNQPFEAYLGNIRGSRAKTLCSTVRDHNLSETDASRKIAVFTDSKGAEYSSADAEASNATSVTEINKISGNLGSGKTYAVSFGYDPDSGLVTAVYIVEVTESSTGD